MEFFPKELWSTLDPNFDGAAANPSDPKSKGKRKILKIGKASGNILEELEKAERRFKLENFGAEDDELDQEEVEEEEEDKMEEERDTDYGEDEDENDDYNAEAYFSNGEDEPDEGMGDYDDGGGGYYE
jgi:DNA-directed RNA polymerase III subunit RPC7